MLEKGGTYGEAYHHTHRANWQPSYIYEGFLAGCSTGTFIRIAKETLDDGLFG